MMSSQYTKKEKVHNELKLRYNEFIESKLAVTLLNNPKHFSSVRKVSDEIARLILDNKEAVLNTIKSNMKIIDELREPYFGCLYNETEQLTSNKVLNKMLSALTDGNSGLDKIMQIHCIFIHRLYDSLPNKIDKTPLKNELFPATLFSIRGRTSKAEPINPTTKLGIANHSVFTKMLGESNKKHLRALERFTPDYRATFFKGTQEENIPVVCGPSGHTGSLLMGAKLYGNLKTDELREYAFACFVFLTAGGNHSFHEVITIANLIGADFKRGCYASAIPESIKQSDEFKNMKYQFPELSTYQSNKLC